MYSYAFLFRIDFWTKTFYSLFVRTRFAHSHDTRGYRVANIERPKHLIYRPCPAQHYTSIYTELHLYKFYFFRRRQCQSESRNRVDSEFVPEISQSHCRQVARRSSYVDGRDSVPRNTKNRRRCHSDNYLRSIFTNYFGWARRVTILVYISDGSQFELSYRFQVNSTWKNTD